MKQKVRKKVWKFTSITLTKQELLLRVNFCIGQFFLHHFKSCFYFLVVCSLKSCGHNCVLIPGDEYNSLNFIFLYIKAPVLKHFLIIMKTILMKKNYYAFWDNFPLGLIFLTQSEKFYSPLKQKNPFCFIMRKFFFQYGLWF